MASLAQSRETSGGALQSALGRVVDQGRWTGSRQAALAAGALLQLTTLMTLRIKKLMLRFQTHKCQALQVSSGAQAQSAQAQSHQDQLDAESRAGTSQVPPAAVSHGTSIALRIRLLPISHGDSFQVRSLRGNPLDAERNAAAWQGRDASIMVLSTLMAMLRWLLDSLAQIGKS